MNTTDPNILHWMKGKVISKDKCELSDMKLGPMELCFRASHSTLRTCSGDPGGPLVCLDGNRVVITGVLNFGYEDDGTGYCRKKGIGDVFTNVSHFLSWIQAFMEPKEVFTH